MTIAKQEKAQRKNSWESKISISTISTANRTYKRSSPSSVLSSDSDIRFTRKKLTSQYKCGCCIITLFLIFLLLAAAAVYLGYTIFLPQAPEDQIFKATFKVVKGDVFSSELTDTNSTKFKNTSRDYRERLNLLFRRSPVKNGFIGSDVLALDGTDGKDLIVHFDIRIDPTYIRIGAKDLENILASEIAVKDSKYFQNLTIDPRSVEVRPSDMIPTTTVVTIVTETTTQIPKPPRKCAPMALDYCKSLGYNITTYPNIFKHTSVEDVMKNVIPFRELVDAECNRHAYDFICQVLQPSCTKGDKEDAMVLPCRSFCRDFLTGCGSRLSGHIKEALDCNTFPEYRGDGTCLIKPGCVEDLQSRALSPRICDGVVDCQDIADEKNCAYCPQGHLHCGIGRMCISKTKRCDGISDCPDGSDERGCLSLAPNTRESKKSRLSTPHMVEYYSEGYVTFNDKGEIGKLCTENIQRNLPSNQTFAVLQSVASSLCQTLTYKCVLSMDVETDLEEDVSYVKMRNPTASEISFIRTRCPSKKVLKVSCSDLECGVQNTHGHNGLKILSKMATHGDWPWHVALFKEDVHICDGTLVSPDWVATTTSCFQGQPKAEWTARFSITRLFSSTPWEQERRIIGMLKSPVEGSTIALIKLEQPVTLNDFVRPICLPTENMSLSNAKMQCNTLGWTRNREQLQRVQVKMNEMEKCENISIPSVNYICTEAVQGMNDCNEEELAGSPMICQYPDNKWTLVGITNWRIACAKSGLERPRLYDKISSNVNWIRDSISSGET